MKKVSILLRLRLRLRLRLLHEFARVNIDEASASAIKSAVCQKRTNKKEVRPTPPRLNYVVVVVEVQEGEEGEIVDSKVRPPSWKSTSNAHACIMSFSPCEHRLRLLYTFYTKSTAQLTNPTMRSPRI